MTHLLFGGYLLLFCWLLTKIGFFQRSGLQSALLILIFLLKLFVGFVYGWLSLNNTELIQMTDSLVLHKYGLYEYSVLKKDPWHFFSHIFVRADLQGLDGFFSSYNSFWNDLRGLAFAKFLGILNLFSFGNYYINLIFFCFLMMFGTVALYRLFTTVYKQNKLAILIAVSLIPSFVFWTSGLHKDGLVFLAVSLVIYCVFRMLEQGWKWKFVIIGFLCLLIILMIRNYIVVLIVPAILAWVIAWKVKKHPLTVFTVIYIFYAVFFFTARYIHPALDFPAAAAQKQNDFSKLKGYSAVPTRHLEPTAISFIRKTPQALAITTLRPFPSDAKHIGSLLATLETLMLVSLLVLYLLIGKMPGRRHAFILFCIFFSFSVLLSIGYTVQFLGAIVRYRSIVLPLLITPLVANMNWEMLADNIRMKKNYN